GALGRAAPDRRSGARYRGDAVGRRPRAIRPTRSLRHGVAEIPIDGLDRVPRAWRHREYATKESQVSSHRADEVGVADKSALLEAIEMTAGTPWRSLSPTDPVGVAAKQLRPPACLRTPRGGWARAVALLAAALCAPAVALALDPGKSIDQYGHDTWTPQNGLPGEAVYHILQSRDGYLWLRTSAGLVRFDGAHFVTVFPRVAGKIVEEPIKAIAQGADGDLLVRSTSRTLIYHDGTFRDYRPPAPLADGDILTLFESKQHEVFVGSDDFVYLIENAGAKRLRRATGWIY